MVNVEVKIDGKRVNPNNVKDAMMKSILNKVSSDIKNKLSSVVCDEHNERPTVVIEGKSFDSLSFKVSGCCESLILKTKELMK